MFGVRPRHFRPDPKLSRGFSQLPATKRLQCCGAGPPKSLTTNGQQPSRIPGDNPEIMMENRQKTEILRKCLTQLSPTHREVIDLVYYHEKSIDEVGEITGVPRNTVKTRMFYARKRIAELMTAQGTGRAML
jgi:RNA polymerase sigma-70 factor, ECF subfamily